MNEPKAESTSGHSSASGTEPTTDPTYSYKEWERVERAIAGLHQSIKIALLEGIKNDIKTCMVPGPHQLVAESDGTLFHFVVKTGRHATTSSSQVSANDGGDGLRDRVEGVGHAANVPLPMVWRAA